jgi:predicted nucleotidyltransferase
MAIGPRNPKEIFPEIISDYKGVFGADLVSIILYGSAAGKDYRPGRSDINFMIVLTGEGIERLDRAFDMVKRWRKRNVAIPLFLTEGYIKTSLDVFPVEYLSFKRNYVLIYGKDVLAFLETSGRGKALKELVANSIPALIAIFEALLYIKGKEIPRERREIVRSVAEAFGVDRSVFESLVEIKAEEVKLTDREIREFFKGYLREMRRLSGLVDALGGGDE